MPAHPLTDSLFAHYPRPQRQDCSFYHSFDLPEGEIIGQWDLRQHADQYLGGVALNQRSVLEVGPASGFLSFHMENQGAQVTCVEPPLSYLWDAVPFADYDLEHWRQEFTAEIQKVRNSFWYVHHQKQSRVRLLAEVHLDYFGRTYRRSIELFTRDGTITADFGAGTLTLADGTVQHYEEDVNERYRREMAYFLEYAAGGSGESVNTPAQALDVLRLTLGEE